MDGGGEVDRKSEDIEDNCIAVKKEKGDERFDDVFSWIEVADFSDYRQSVLKKKSTPTVD